LVDESVGPGGSRWTAAQPDTVEHIVIEFDRPQSVTRLVYEVEVTERERTQEVHVEVSNDGGKTYRRVLAQEYNFSRAGPRSSERTYASRRATSAICGSPSCRTNTGLAWPH